MSTTILPVYRYRAGKPRGLIHAALPDSPYSEVYRTLCGAHEGRRAYELQVVTREDVTCKRCLRSTGSWTHNTGTKPLDD